MSKKIILFDVDGVLAEFIGGFTAKARSMFPELDIPVTLSDEQPSWNGFPGMDQDLTSRVWDNVKQDPHFWADLLPLVDKHTAARIDALCEEEEVYFVTARVGVYAKQQTEDWLLSRLGLFNPTVIISKKKGEFAKAVGAHYCIDDKASNASTVAWLTEDKTKSYLLDRPYNRVGADFLASSITRIASVNDYLNVIEGRQAHVCAN